jgi:hypothetical protein
MGLLDGAYINDTTNHDVYQIDTHLHTFTATIPISGPAPVNSKLRVSPDESLVLATTGASIIPIPTATLTPGASIALGAGAIEDIGFTPDGTSAWCVGQTKIVQVNIPALTIGSSFTIAGSGGAGIAIAPDGIHAYISHSTGIYPVNLSTLVVGPVITTAPDVPQYLAYTPDGTQVFASALNSTGHVWSVTTATNTLVTYSIPGAAVSFQPFDVAVTLDGANAWFSIVDPAAVAPHNYLIPISCVGHVIGSKVAFPNTVAGIAVRPDNAEIEVVSPGATGVYPMTIPANVVGSLIAVGAGGHPNYIAIGPVFPAATVTLPKLFIPVKGVPSYSPQDLNADFLDIEEWANAVNKLIGSTVTLFIPHKAPRIPNEMNANWLTIAIWANDIAAPNSKVKGPILTIPRWNSLGAPDLTVNFLAIQNWANRL